MKVSNCVWPFLALLMLGCGDSPEPDLDFQSNLQKWRNAGLSSYEFTYKVACFCPGEGDIQIQVKNDSIVQALYAESGQPVSQDRLAVLYTVEGLFQIIEEAQTEPADRLEVTYNQKYGYPESISIDWDFQIADEEIDHFARDLR